MDKEKDKKDQPTSNVSTTPFSDAVEEAMSANEERKGRLKLAIKNHAIKARKVKARRAPK